MDPGSWVMFELPGFTSAAAGKQQDSLDALRKASETSYFKDKDSLWIKLVAAAPVSPIIRPTDLQARMTVSR
jgi:cell migration-inducing and hyaluronan-binding protein